jgi:hypothetical protein
MMQMLLHAAPDTIDKCEILDVHSCAFSLKKVTFHYTKYTNLQPFTPTPQIGN